MAIGGSENLQHILENLEDHVHVEGGVKSKKDLRRPQSSPTAELTVLHKQEMKAKAEF